MAALSVIYSNFCGMVVSETRNGVESDYISDTLGSTIGLLDSAGTMTDRWEYWPYGEVVSRTGTSVTPLTFLGILGYFQDVLSKLFYVRARHLRADLARWLTVDTLWPSQNVYAYVRNAPLQRTDPTGLADNLCDAIYDAAMLLCALEVANCGTWAIAACSSCYASCEVAWLLGPLAWALCFIGCTIVCAVALATCAALAIQCAAAAFFLKCLCLQKSGGESCVKSVTSPA